MKKALGLLALVTAAGALVAYKLKKDEETKKDTEVSDDSESILRAVEAQGFKPIDYDTVSEKKPEPFSAKAFPHLDESDIIAITNRSEESFKAIEGLDAKEERPIQHSIIFEKEIDLEEFKNIVIGEGYVVTNGEKEHELLVLHISKMDQDDISAKVFYIADLAKAHEGVYEGWICKQ